MLARRHTPRKEFMNQNNCNQSDPRHMVGRQWIGRSDCTKYREKRWKITVNKSMYDLLCCMPVLLTTKFEKQLFQECICIIGSIYREKATCTENATVVLSQANQYCHCFNFLECHCMIKLDTITTTSPLHMEDLLELASQNTHIFLLWKSWVSTQKWAERRLCCSWKGHAWILHQLMAQPKMSLRFQIAQHTWA